MDQDPVSQSDSDTPVKVDDLWFTTDTIIVIRAENRIFRVSGGILAARSTVFRDMIGFPQPKGGDAEQFEGCPVVRLHDSAQDVEVFLRAIYDSSYFMPAPTRIDCSVVLGILRMSHKYDVQYLYLRALDHLAVDGWYRITFDQKTADHLINAPGLTASLPVIQAALEVGATWILPYAFYCLSTFSGDKLFPLLGDEIGPHIGKAMAVHAHLVRGTIAINRFLTTHNPCNTPEFCDAARKSALSDLLDNVSDPEVDPLRPDLELYTMSALKVKGMCDECRGLAKQQQHAAATAFWDELPTLFGFPPWEELHAMKRAAMGEEAGDAMSN
ncbi:hypothetical protein C8F04DRAFT_958479 [Mycena alexandri]|uniref:BTB domain-containing protein n=1 Tax=Mycena alexandri TaxID=1745969 RepID=A0AAD6X218_9AGAR|nr:hypothetical protein C8F04DRAFT_958479 [Mycena alexandri]